MNGMLPGPCTAAGCGKPRRYGIPPEGWLDLSTGINPHAYPVSPIPDDLWARLPEDDDGLIDTARILRPLSCEYPQPTA